VHILNLNKSKYIAENALVTVSVSENFEYYIQADYPYIFRTSLCIALTMFEHTQTQFLEASNG